MTFTADLAHHAQTVCAHAALDVDVDALVESIRRLGDDDVVRLVADATTLIGLVERVRLIGVGVIAERSAAPRGGLSGSRGHRSPVTLVQEITGGTRGDAIRTVRVGTAIVDATDASQGGRAPDVGGPGVGGPTAGAPEPDAGGPTAGAPEGTDAAGSANAERPRVVWHAELRHALLRGDITAAQHDAIRRGLGEPPAVKDGESVWAVAVEQLLNEASGLPAEALAARARAVRDALDPVGVQARFDKRFAARSWRMWIDDDGAHHARIAFDDEMAPWIRSIVDAALRPRRGGPRFLTDAERAQAAELADDPRTNDQLAYDLMMDVLRAGALASADDVFGARQPGVRLVTVADAIGPRDAFGRLRATVHVEDGGAGLPGPVLDTALCNTGTRPVTVDSCGNPLDVGREQRLFTAKQRIALSVRDGGCVWPGCDRDSSYCEAHHIDHYAEDCGRTDIDRGVLLCRFHHLTLHNQGWKITRTGHGPFMLHPPRPQPDSAAEAERTGDGAREVAGAAGFEHDIERGRKRNAESERASVGTREPIPLQSRSPVRWAWDPPPDRTHWRAA